MKQIRLTTDLIDGVLKGEGAAQEMILQYYNQYLNSLVTTVSEDEYGNEHYQLDEDLKIQIQYKYLEAIKKWKVIEK